MPKHRPHLWTTEALAAELAVPADQLEKALAEMPSDGRIDGQPAWFLVTVIPLLSAASEHHASIARQEAYRCMVRILAVLRTIPDALADLGADAPMVEAARQAIKQAEDQALEAVANFNQDNAEFKG